MVVVIFTSSNGTHYSCSFSFISSDSAHLSSFCSMYSGCFNSLFLATSPCRVSCGTCYRFVYPSYRSSSNHHAWMPRGPLTVRQSLNSWPSGASSPGEPRPQNLNAHLRETREPTTTSKPPHLCTDWKNVLRKFIQVDCQTRGKEKKKTWTMTIAVVPLTMKA